ncbi:hypothetical protein C8J57DRAFT_1655870 [Mycena rebaudengoi]|nr:hypothetical protein C8J57DRAFT_1655870 [Mycena rebaudengoi]
MAPCSAYADTPVSSYNRSDCTLPDPNLPSLHPTPSDPSPSSNGNQPQNPSAPEGICAMVPTEPPAVQELYGEDDRNGAPQFPFCQRMGNKPAPDCPQPLAEPYSAAVRASQEWRDEFEETGDIEAVPFSLVGAMSKYLGPHHNREGREEDRYAVSGKLWRLNPETGRPYTETGTAIVLWFKDPHHQHLQWFLDHPACSTENLVHSMAQLHTPDFPASTFPVNSNNYIHPIELNPFPPNRVPHADDLIDPHPLPRIPSNLPDSDYVFLPAFMHPHDSSVRILNGFFTHDATLPKARFKRHVVERHRAHEPVPDTWMWFEVVNGATHYLEPAPESDQPPDASFPPHSTEFLTFPDNRWTGTPITSPSRAPYGRQSVAMSSMPRDHPEIAQVPSRHDLRARPTPAPGYTTPLTLIESFCLEHNLPDPSVHRNHQHADELGFCLTCCGPSSEGYGTAEDTDSDDRSSVDALANFQQPRSPLPPPPPAVSYLAPSAPIPPSAESSDFTRIVTTHSLHTHPRLLLDAPPLHFLRALSQINTLNVDFLALRSRPAELETDGASETSEESNGICSYVPAPPPSLAKLTHVTHTDTPTWRDSTNAHFACAHWPRMLRIACPHASVQPLENPFLAPLCPPLPESARHGEYFYGYCLNDDPLSHDRANIASPGLIDSGLQVSFTFAPRGPPSTVISNSSSSSASSRSSCNDVSLYDEELEYPPTPPPI